MKLSYFAALVVTLGSAEAKVSIAALPKLLSHEHGEAIGLAHTEVFDMLGAKYSKQRPKDKDDMMKDIGEIMASFCDDEESKESCISNSLSHAERVSEEEIVYPDDFDATLLEYVDDIYTTLNTLSEGNVDEVLSKLDAIKEKMKALKDVNPIHRHAAIAGASVAGESTKLWVAAYSDVKHPLHGLHHGSFYTSETSESSESEDPDVRRRLTSNCFPAVPVVVETETSYSYSSSKDWIWIPGWGYEEIPDSIGLPQNWLLDRFSLIDIIQADIDGSVFGILDEAEDDPIIALQPPQLFQEGFTGAVTRSAGWALAPPTPAPSSTPSLAPSISCAPTSVPSSSPSDTPTGSPSISSKPTTSSSPSGSPSSNPTVTSKPSKAPSTSPSAAPVASPSADPSASPSAAPVASPSAAPVSSAP